MSRSLLACLVIAGLACPVFAAPVPKAAAKQFTFPTAVGTKWVYQDEDGKREWTEEITASEKRDGATLVTINSNLGGGSSQSTFAINTEGVTEKTLERFTIGYHILKFPPKKGETWTFETPIQVGLLAGTGRMTIGDEEEVVVPAGKYKAFPVEHETTSQNGKELPKPEKFTYWYSSQVGEVQRSGENYKRVLKTFTPAAKK